MRKTATIAVLATLLTVSVVFNYSSSDYISSLEGTIATQEQTITAQEQQIEQDREYISQLEGDIHELEDNVRYLMSENDNLRSEVSHLEDVAEYWKDEATNWENESDTWMEAYYELENLRGYIEFGSLRELEQWLRDDPTSQHSYSSSYDCDDFAIDLTLSAIRDGYWIGLYSEEDHVMNFTIIGNLVYIIEPQTDYVELWGFAD